MQISWQLFIQYCMELLVTGGRLVIPALLSEDYEDELAERVRGKVQGEKESIRDSALSYRVLCKRWKADLTEGDIIKMTLKNIKPYLASPLRSRVSTVEELVRLGHQLEKDYEQQLKYDSRTTPKYHTSTPFIKSTCRQNHNSVLEM